MRKSQQRSGCERAKDGNTEEIKGKRDQSPTLNESSQASHPSHMTGEEFNALPCWSDAEDGPAYNIRYRPRLAVNGGVRLLCRSDPAHRALSPQSVSPLRFVPLSWDGPHVYPRTQRFVGIRDADSVLSLAAIPRIHLRGGVGLEGGKHSHKKDMPPGSDSRN